LYFLLYEICTNDIKYGKEESTWILDIQNYNLLIYQKNLIKSKSDSSSFSLKSVSTRIESLGGTVSNRVIGNQFELNLKIPWINELN
nr:signaling protein [Leptospira sp.]